MSLAQRLRTLMRWRGIHSQNQLARISGVPQSCIHRILTREDRYSPERGTLLRLAHALETSVPWLTDGVVSVTDPGPRTLLQGYGAAQPMDAATVDAYCAEICALLRHQPVSTKKKVLTVVRLMVE
ncbi:helix-turn-helix transcriptional regulator [Achromobacter seleniivolatilans]|uniref:Helix-turn-helix transcriptional regulator n=1 Tax=Achromobacter seleniivolatilans TaxID=3047478 RepID=A0ABY9MAC8_9BURK|nr:helix-turn-helix transcriptional regulator [Achromobacter sp. R39]WMD23785.1 helix-turn-helix transcriptional regulator [Achromobacter sp. R39]